MEPTLEKHESWLMDIESRLLFLEGSLPYHREEGKTKPVYQDMEFSKRQWDSINQLKGLTLHLESKLNEHIDKKKRQPPRNILLTNNK